GQPVRPRDLQLRCRPLDESQRIAMADADALRHARRAGRVEDVRDVVRLRREVRRTAVASIQSIAQVDDGGWKAEHRVRRLARGPSSYANCRRAAALGNQSRALERHVAIDANVVRAET